VRLEHDVRAATAQSSAAVWEKRVMGCPSVFLGFFKWIVVKRPEGDDEVYL
jgi:hypothetical protein